MKRLHVAGAVVVLWLIALGWLVARQYRRPASAVLAEAALRVPPGATYFSVQIGKRQVGFAANQLDTLQDTIRVQELLVLQIPGPSQTERIESRTVTFLTRALELRAFETTLRSGGSRFVARGNLDTDSLLVVDLEGADGRRRLRAPIRRPLTVPALLPLHLTFLDPPALGKTYAFDLFDPHLLTVRPIDLTVTAESTIVVPDSAAYDTTAAWWVPVLWDTVHTWRFSERLETGEMHTWIDELGQVVEAHWPAGYEQRRTAFELAFENFQNRGNTVRAAAPLDDAMVPQTVIAAGRPIPGDRVAELRLRLRTGSLDAPSPAGGRPLLPGDTLVLGAVPATAFVEPDRRRAHSLDRYETPDLLIESNDVRIEAQARQIVGRNQSPARVAELLTDWVFDALEKRPAAGPPDAVRVLENRSGDCNEHTVLYAALARAVGLPVRTVAGLVYLDGRFYYHAWPEVYLNGWVAVDPTLGQFPADARHIRLTTDAFAGHLELVRSIGRLGFDVLASRKT